MHVYIVSQDVTLLSSTN